MKKNLTISLNLKEDEEIRKFINEMIVSQVKSISRELIKTVVQEHINRAIEESIDKQASNLRYSIAKLYEKERLDRYKELQSSIQEEADKITSEILVNAKEDIQKVLSKIVSDMVWKAISNKK